MPSTETTIRARNGGEIPAYFATPEKTPAMGVVLIATILGVDKDMKAYADDLARNGLCCIAPDPFWQDEDPGVVPPTEEGWKRAHARNDRHDIDQCYRDLEDTVADLKSRPECNGKIAVMGFCFGGPHVLLAAARLGIDAGIAFHGSHVGDFLDEAPKVGCPLCFNYGDKDFVASMEEIGRIKAAFDKLDDAEVNVYPGCGHGYMQPSRGEGYDDDAAKKSWARALEVLKAAA